MNQNIHAPFKLIMLIIACVLFVLAGLGGPWTNPQSEWPWRGRMIAWGLFFWCASSFVS
jgi:hypothetical protein